MVDTRSQRVAYGETLVELGMENENIVVLEADLGKSTMGIKYQAAYPNRFFEMGIAEANMACTAAGLSLVGKIPFIASFAVFSTGRCYDQIRTSICIPKLNVKICGSSAGLSNYGDGSTHQSIDDIAIMRVLPNMQVFVPVDAVQTAQIVRYMASHEGPMYLRVNRNDLPVYTEEDTEFIPGKVYTIREGTDAVVFAYGVMVSFALKAAEDLAEKGVSVRVVNVPSIKPICKDSILDICADIRGIVTAEESSVVGGLGAAIAETIAGNMGKQIQMVGIKDSFGTSARCYEDLLQKYELTAEAIVAAVKKSLI